MNTATATWWASFFTFATVLGQTLANQWGAERARKHELELKRLENEDDEEEKKE